MTILQGLPNYSNFVKLYSNEHGLTFKDALKDESIKEILSRNNMVKLWAFRFNFEKVI